MRLVKWGLILIIICLLGIVIGSFVIDKKAKDDEQKYGTPISDISYSYKVSEICSNYDNCDETIEIDDFNKKTIMINYKHSSESKIDQIKVGKLVFNPEEDTQIDSFGTYKNKFFVLVLNWSTSLTDATKEVIYYDKDFNIIQDIKLVSDDFSIELSSYKYYSCEINNESTGEINSQKYTINFIEIDDNFNFNKYRDSEMYQVCSTKEGY